VDFHSAALKKDSHDHNVRVAERLSIPDDVANGEGGEEQPPPPRLRIQN
jgi:hypothetical protein